MSDTKYTKKLTKTIDFEFWFEDEEKACEYLELDTTPLCLSISEDYMADYMGEDGFLSGQDFFYRDDKHSDEITFTNVMEGTGVIKFKVTEKWG